MSQNELAARTQGLTIRSMERAEVWRPVPGHEGVYAVSSHGRVKRVLASPGAQANLILSQEVQRTGYHQVTLYQGGRTKFRRYKVHRLVALAFLPNPDGLPQVNHRDGNKSNNHVGNLEWVTARQNIRHAERNGLRPKARGEASGKNTLTATQVLSIRAKAADGATHRMLAKEYGVGEAQISRIVRRIQWRHI